MFRTALVGTLIACVMAPAATSLLAQGNACAPRDVIVTRLSDKYAETLTGGGMQNTKTLLEVWSSAETGSFTVLVTHSNGMSCIVSSGHHWSFSAQVAMGPKDSES